MFIHKPKYGGKLVKGRCEASVADPNSRSFLRWQCTRKTVVSKMFEGALHDFCTVHDPDKVAARQKAAQERYDADLKKRILPYKKSSHYEEVLIQITNLKDNIDAVKLAKRALAKFK